MRAAVLSRFATSTLARLTALGFVLVGAAFGPSQLAQAGGTMESRKLPMRFDWVACEPNCGGWISAVGIVTADTPKDFDEFARGRTLDGTAVVLDSSGGSVNDAITLGRRWRKMNLATTVGTTLPSRIPGARASIAPEAYCESMCVFLLLSGKTRYVPDAAHVRVHQIWMGDRAEDARGSNYSAQDLTIVQRDIGRLAKFTFEMGGTGDLLSLALSVPPWDDLHELSRQELRDTNLITAQALAELLPPRGEPTATPVAAAIPPKSVQDRFLPSPVATTKTAEAALPTGGIAQPAAPPALGH